RHGDVFRFVQRLLDEGYDLAEFYRGLADALRTLMIVKFDGPDAIEVREDLRDAYAAAAARFSTGDLVRMLAQVAELDTDGRFRKSANPRILLEAVLLRFAHLDRTVELEDLLRAAAGPGVGRAAWEQAKAALATASATAAGPAATPAARSAAGPARSADPAAPAAPAAPGAADPAQAADPAVRSTADAARSAAPARSATSAFQSMLADQDGIPRGLG